MFHIQEVEEGITIIRYIKERTQIKLLKIKNKILEKYTSLD